MRRLAALSMLALLAGCASAEQVARLPDVTGAWVPANPVVVVNQAGATVPQGPARPAVQPIRIGAAQ